MCCRHQNKVMSASVVLAALVVADCRTNSYGPDPDPDHPAANPAVLAVGFVLVTGLLQPLLPFCLLLLSCAGLSGAPRVLSGALSVRVLKWVADVSYDVYLLHPMVIMGLWSVLPPSAWFTPDSVLPFWAVTCLVMALSIVAAVLHMKFVSSVTRLWTCIK